jgi:hypothetical protein
MYMLYHGKLARTEVTADCNVMNGSGVCVLWHTYARTHVCLSWKRRKRNGERHLFTRTVPAESSCQTSVHVAPRLSNPHYAVSITALRSNVLSLSVHGYTCAKWKNYPCFKVIVIIIQARTKCMRIRDVTA